MPGRASPRPVGSDCEADAAPFLTTFEQPLEEMEDKAMVPLLGQVDTGKLPSPPRHLFPARLGSAAAAQKPKDGH